MRSGQNGAHEAVILEIIEAVEQKDEAGHDIDRDPAPSQNPIENG